MDVIMRTFWHHLFLFFFFQHPYIQGYVDRLSGRVYLDLVGFSDASSLPDFDSGDGSREGDGGEKEEGGGEVSLHHARGETKQQLRERVQGEGGGLLQVTATLSTSWCLPVQCYQSFLASRLFSGSKLLLFMLHCCHLLIMHQPNHIFDVQFVHVFKALDAVRWASEVWKVQSANAPHLQSPGRSCSHSSLTPSDSRTSLRRPWAESGWRRGDEDLCENRRASERSGCSFDLEIADGAH